MRRATLAAVPVFAIACVLATAASSSGSTRQVTRHAAAASSSLGTVIFGTLPPVGGKAVANGTITQGQLTGQTPTYIFPIVPSSQSNPGTSELITSVFMPLYNGPSGARPQYEPGDSAAAGPPKPSNGDKTYTITLKNNLKWSDGSKVTGQDVVFDIDLLKAGVKESAANWGQYTVGQFPMSVKSVSAKGQTVTIHLNKAYNPGYFLNNQLQVTNYGVYPLPSKKWNISSAGGKPITDWATNPKDAKAIFDYVNKLGGEVGQFSSAVWKMSDGPFTLASYNTTNNSYVLKPNPNYGGTPRPKATVDVNTYTSFTSELNAMKSGGLDMMLGFDPSQIPQMASLKSQGILAYGGPGFGWFGGVLNYKNTTNDFDKVVSQLYVRQALQYLINQPAIIKGVYKGAAVTAYGPIPSAPTSPYTPQSATHPYYPFSPHKAVALLKAHGWKVVPKGTTTCENPGTKKNQCGAGIPKGTPISIVWANQPQSVSSFGALESEAFASDAKQFAGINVSFQTKTFNFLVTNYNNANPAAKKYASQWGVNNYGGLGMNYFPTQEGAWNTTGAFNAGGFSDPVANKLMLKSVFGTNADAVTKEADYFSKNLPVLFLPDLDYMVAVNSKKMGSVAEDGWTTTTQIEFFPQYWFAK